MTVDQSQQKTSVLTVLTTIVLVPVNKHCNMCRTSFWSASSAEQGLITGSVLNVVSFCRIPFSMVKTIIMPILWISRNFLARKGFRFSLFLGFFMKLSLKSVGNSLLPSKLINEPNPRLFFKTVFKVPIANYVNTVIASGNVYNVCINFTSKIIESEGIKWTL